MQTKCGLVRMYMIICMDVCRLSGFADICTCVRTSNNHVYTYTEWSILDHRCTDTYNITYCIFSYTI